MSLALPLSASSRAQLARELNHVVHQLLLAEWQLRQAHWNTRGAWFFARHELFERISDTTSELVDTLAERIGALGHPVEMRPMVIAGAAPEPLPSGLQSGETFLQGIAQHLVRVAADLRGCNDSADKLHDPVTADIATGAAQKVEHALWFLRSHLPPVTPLTTEPATLPKPPASSDGAVAANSDMQDSVRQLDHVHQSSTDDAAVFA